MATLTATTFANPASGRPGETITISGSYNSGATSLDASAVTILLAKIPNGARIVEAIEHHSTGSATCPLDYGIAATLSAFSSQGTQGTVNRLSVGANLNYQVSLSDSANAANYQILKATPTPGTATASFKLIWACTYVMP